MTSLFPDLDKPYDLGWDGVPMKGTLDLPIAFDTETVAIDEQGKPNDLRLGPPRMVLATVSDGQRHFVLPPEQLPDWIIAHQDQHLVGHNFSFDFWVVHRCLKDLKREDLIPIWFSMGDRSLFHDTMLLDLLVMLAEGKNDDGSEKLEPRNLGILAKQYAPKIVVNKEDPFRMRYHELVGIDFVDWEEKVDPGFFSYAIDDAKATREIWSKLLPRARKLQSKHLPQPGQKCYVMYPDSEARFGVLTEQIQVKGSIGLLAATHNGMRFDPERAEKLETKTRKQVKKSVKYLRKHYPGLFTIDKKTGDLKLQEKSKMPSMRTAYLEGVLQTLANRYQFKAPQSQGKTKGISTSVKTWKEFHKLDPFFDHWISVGINSKLLGFFDALKKADNCIVRSNYKTLVRTGRTSCSRVNLQQMPRTEEFRAMFVASSGKKLVTCDYSAIELRTLAAVCKHKLGYSKLAEVFSLGHGKDDPHAFTAAMVLKTPFEEFLQWKHSTDEHQVKQFKKTRQSAKACFHPDVEILTSLGWKKVSEVELTDKVAQYWPTSKVVEFVNPYALTSRDDKELLRVHNEGVDLRVTPDHRMLGYRNSGNPVVCHPEEMNSVMRGIWNAGVKKEGVLLGNVSPEIIQQLVCIQADGSVTESGNHIRFGFTKQRKIDRFRQLFSNYDESVSSQGVATFTISWNTSYNAYLDKQKNFNQANVLKLPISYREIFLEELRHWDGHTFASGKMFGYYSTNLHNCNVVQSVAAISGFKSSLKISAGKQKHHALRGSVSLKRRDYSRAGNFSTDHLGVHSKVYCLSVPSSFLIVRDGGKPVVVGNCNFGIPGGLGKTKLADYARNSYDVDMSEEEADTFRKKIINEVYPELNESNGYLAFHSLLDLSRNVGIPFSTLEEFLKGKFHNMNMMLHLTEKIARGITSNKAGRPYADSMVDRIWTVLNEILDQATTVAPDIVNLVRERKGSPRLAAVLFNGTTCTLTGRIRGRVGYTQSKNTPFQSLAADGAKLAIWRIVMEGYRIVAFVHDEIVIEVDADKAVEAEKKIQQIMIEEMERVLTAPNETKAAVPVKCESAFADAWGKP